MKNTSLKYMTMLTGLSVLLMTALGMASGPVCAQTIAVRSAIVAPGDTISVPVEISGDIAGVRGFQMDLEIIPSAGAPTLTLYAITKGAAATITSSIASNPTPPTPGPVRIGLPQEIHLAGSPKPSFNGPGSIVDLEVNVPSNAIPGQNYRLNLFNVILADTNNEPIPLNAYGGTLTVGSPTVLADTIDAPPSLTVTEPDSKALIVTVTGGGQPVPGVDLLFRIDNPEKASVSVDTARTGSAGQASVNVTGLEDGSTIIRISSPGLAEASIDVTVMGVSPVIISTLLLEILEDQTYSYDVDATDPQGQTLTYHLLESPTGMTIDANTGAISWANPSRPSPTQTSVRVTVEVHDPDGNSDTQSFSIFIIVDADNDGHDDRTDCDDTNPSINPGVPETPYNDLDDDCNPATPDDDLDGDGYLHAVDCDDTNPSVNPDAIEIVYNGLDDDCDSSTLDYTDSDGDGYPDAADARLF